MMGQGWRRISEQARQKWGLTLEKNFKATSNARNEAMFIEASKFSSHLRQFEKDLRGWETSIEAGLTNTRVIMLSPLPRVYEEGHSGQAIPSDPEPCMIGGDVQVERLTSSAQELKKRLDAEVIQPIKQWMVAYRTIQERMKRLEALRLELDSRRRTVSALQGKCERQRSNLGTTKARGEADMEFTMRKMQHKEDKMQRTQTAYHELEQTVYNSLFTLIKDTSVLRDYAAAAVLIVQECFQGAYAAFEPQMPQYSQSNTPTAFVENKYDAKVEKISEPARVKSQKGGLRSLSTKQKTKRIDAGSGSEYQEMLPVDDSGMKTFDQAPYAFSEQPIGQGFDDRPGSRYWTGNGY